MLLVQAGTAGKPAKSLRAAARDLPPAERRNFEPRMQAAKQKARLLQQTALTNWVIAQKTLLHLSQMLEMIATGGRLQPTYGMMGDSSPAGGALLNEVG
jgi:uncharacterized membrane protein